MMRDRRCAEIDRAIQPSDTRWIETLLRDQGMPRDEARTVVTSDDAELVRHHLELHIERLEENLASRRREVAAIERILIGTEFASRFLGSTAP